VLLLLLMLLLLLKLHGIQLHLRYFIAERSRALDRSILIG
jgi:hypothetical protein